MAAKTVYAEDPLRTAAEWESRGARWLHLVDLDRATGSGDNTAILEKVIGASGVSVEVGGGVRSLDDFARWVDAGAERVCVGTRSIDPAFLETAAGRFGDHLVVAMDARGDDVQVDGWLRSSGLSTKAAIEQASSLGARRIMYTDIGRDGTLEGPNLRGLESVLEQAAGRLGIIASGGVKTRDDVAALARMAGRGLEGVVIGRALYSGSLSLEDALVASARTSVQGSA